MSLLNDALKAAEQRQDKPAPSPYTGQAAAVLPRRSNTGMVVTGIGVIAILGVGAYLYLDSATAPAVPAIAQVEPDSPATEATATGPSTRPADTETAESPSTSGVAQATFEEQEPVQLTEALADPDQGTGSVVLLDSQESEPEPAQPRDVAPAPPGPEPVAKTEASAAAEATAPVPVQRGPKPPARTASKVRTEPEDRTAPTMVQTSDASAAPVPQPSTDTRNIKQTRQTPAQRDLAASRDIRALVANGDLTAAEAMLTELSGTQTAAQSRYAFARGVLARGDVDRALTWVPEDLAARYPDLRLIRARALLARGELGQAVTTLQSGVPPVADNVEYRITLATLLQQQGQSDQAANHWAELIAWDNGQAPWWVGLAIALEGRGDVPAARRAYQQAAALPGLAPSLADYVRQRLQTLGAG